MDLLFHLSGGGGGGEGYSPMLATLFMGMCGPIDYFDLTHTSASTQIKHIYAPTHSCILVL